MLCLDLLNKFKFKLTASVLGSGCQLAVLHPDSLHLDSLHGDQVCDGGYLLIFTKVMNPKNLVLKVT